MVDREKTDLEDQKKDADSMQWRPYRCYCPNCSTLVVGYKNELGICRISCPVCEVKIVRKPMGRRHDRIDIYAPEGQTNEIGNEEASFF